MRLLNLFKDAISDMVSRIILTLIIIVQLVVAIVFLLSTLNIIYSNFQNANKIRNLYDVGIINKIDLVNDGMELIQKANEKDFGEKTNKFNSFCQNSNEFYCVRVSITPVPIEYSKECEDFSEKSDGSSYLNFNVGNKKYIGLHTLRGDKNYFNTYRYDVIDGRNFEDEDFDREKINSSHEIPVILGSNYSDVYSVGDVIMSIADDSDEEIRLKVIGILEKDQYFSDGGFSEQGLYNTNNYILYPIKNLSENLSNDDADEFLDSFFDTLIISKKDSGYLEKIINDNTTNLCEIQIKNVKDKMDYNYEKTKKALIIYIIIFLVIIFFTSINLITSTVSYILEKKKELSINILCGANKADLSIRVFLQNFMIMAISLGLAITINKLLINNLFISLNKEVVILVMIICIILLIVMSIIPIIKLCNLDLNTVIKED